MFEQTSNPNLQPRIERVAKNIGGHSVMGDYLDAIASEPYHNRAQEQSAEEEARPICWNDSQDPVPEKLPHRIQTEKTLRDQHATQDEETLHRDGSKKNLPAAPAIELILAESPK